MLYGSKPLIYISHPIRSDMGDKATAEYMHANCARASLAADRLRLVFPEVDFYVPAEHDLSLQLLWNSGRASMEKILWADCEIIKQHCQGWFYYNFSKNSDGSNQEQEAAQECGLIPDDSTRVFTGLSIDGIESAPFHVLREMFAPLIEDSIARFNEI